MRQDLDACAPRSIVPCAFPAVRGRPGPRASIAASRLASVRFRSTSGRRARSPARRKRGRVTDAATSSRVRTFAVPRAHARARVEAVRGDAPARERVAVGHGVDPHGAVGVRAQGGRPEDGRAEVLAHALCLHARLELLLAARVRRRLRPASAAARRRGRRSPRPRGPPPRPPRAWAPRPPRRRAGRPRRRRRRNPAAGRRGVAGRLRRLGRRGRARAGSRRGRVLPGRAGGDQPTDCQASSASVPTALRCGGWKKASIGAVGSAWSAKRASSTTATSTSAPATGRPAASVRAIVTPEAVPGGISAASGSTRVVSRRERGGMRIRRVVVNNRPCSTEAKVTNTLGTCASSRRSSKSGGASPGSSTRASARRSRSTVASTGRAPPAGSTSSARGVPDGVLVAVGDDLERRAGGTRRGALARRPDVEAGEGGRARGVVGRARRAGLHRVAAGAGERRVDDGIAPRVGRERERVQPRLLGGSPGRGSGDSATVTTPSREAAGRPSARSARIRSCGPRPRVRRRGGRCGGRGRAARR